MSSAAPRNALFALIPGSLLILGCSGPSEAVRDRIARTEATVQQVQQSGMTRESGALQLEEAKDKLAEAHAESDDGDEEQALRLAEKAARCRSGASQGTQS